MSLHVTIDATDDKVYQGHPTDFFLCHSPLITLNGEEVEYVLQNEWPFAMLQVLKFPTPAAASDFVNSPAGSEAPSLVIDHVVLRLESALANVNKPHTVLTPEEVVNHVRRILPKAGHWYRLAVMNTKNPEK